MEVSVESICNQLARHKLLPPEQVRSLRQQWGDEAKDQSAAVGPFCKWLQTRTPITTFQLDLIQRGHADLLAVSDYRLVDRIGKGRMAGVYQGTHVSSGQQVAIKILPPSRSQNPQVLGRFLRETRLAAKLNHDNIVRTFQHGTTSENMHFLIMELLDGEPLDEVLARRKTLTIEEAVHLVSETAEGLDYLNEVGIVHRDLKPANLMVVAGDSAGQGDSLLDRSVKILDIGLGKAMFDETGQDENLTQVGSIVGTVNYMSPEQARNASLADIRADIYSLGCMFYELLTGTTPFADTNIFRQIQRHASEKHKPLIEAGFPEGLSAIVDRMLVKDPAMRYATPGQLIKDLKPFRKAQELVKPAKPLKSFLTWLETRPPEAADADAEATIEPGALRATAVPTATSEMKTATLAPMSAPAAVKTSPTPVPAAPSKPIPIAQPAPFVDLRNNPATPVPTPKTKAKPALAQIAEMHPGDLPEASPVGDPARSVLVAIKEFGWSRRDSIVAGIGGGATLFFVFIVLLIIRLVSG